MSMTSTTNENIEAVKKMILDNRRFTIREVANNAGISLGSCQAIFTNFLGKKPAAAKIVPKLLMSTMDENIVEVKKMILDNRRITIREVANNVGISPYHARQFLRVYYV